MLDSTQPARSSELASLITEVNALSVPIEGIFVAIGDALGTALGVLRTLENDFAGVSSGLNSGAALEANRAFGESIAQCSRLAGASTQTAERLVEVSHAIGLAAPPVGTLRKILEEVASLAINARIQAVQISSDMADFAVFTTEMTRLQRLALDVVDHAAGRLADLRVAIGFAQQVEDEFRQRDAAQLDAVRLRLERGVAALAGRRQLSQSVMANLAVRSGRIAQRVGECITQMQINDLTRQRLEHVREALELAQAIHSNRKAEYPDWVDELDGTRQRLLTASICRLQSTQLVRASDEFRAEVARLKTNMQGLADDTAQTMRDASNLFAGGDGSGSFLHELERDVDDASAILEAYASANVRVRDAVVTVTDGFAVVADHIETIHSIDADMRIMGLNASLKCTRLGSRGRALGVVAQELRGCSHRTQEASQALSGLVTQARENAGWLAQWINDSHGLAETLRGGLKDSLGSLSVLGTSVEESLNALVADCAEVAAGLGRSAEGIAVHDRMHEQTLRIAAALGRLAVDLAPGESGYDGVDEDVHRLLAKSYTMASEREVHGNGGNLPLPEGGDDCDAFFL